MICFRASFLASRRLAVFQPPPNTPKKNCMWPLFTNSIDSVTFHYVISQKNSCTTILCCARLCYTRRHHLTIPRSVLGCAKLLLFATSCHVMPCHVMYVLPYVNSAAILCFLSYIHLLTAAEHPRRGGSVTERTSPLRERLISINADRLGKESVALRYMSERPIGGLLRLLPLEAQTSKKQSQTARHKTGFVGFAQPLPLCGIRVTGPNEPAGFELRTFFGVSGLLRLRELGRRALRGMSGYGNPNACQQRAVPKVAKCQS